MFFVLSLAARGFSPGTPQKPTFPNSNLIRNVRTQLNEFLRTPECFEGKQIPDYIFNNTINYVTQCAKIITGNPTVACVAWRFWLGALSNIGGRSGRRGLRNREENGAGSARFRARLCGFAAQ